MDNKIFINFSNHPSEKWSKEQYEAAAKYGEIKDYAFPAVSAVADEKDIRSLSDKIVADIMAMNPAAVMCQGEFTLVFAVTCRLIKENVPVLTACSERIVTETEDGKKIVTFSFEKFREYNLVV